LNTLVFLVYFRKVFQGHSVKKLRIIFILVLPLVFLVTLYSQENEVAVRLRLAQSFEQSGDWERAAAIYEELYQRDKVNYVLFDALRRAYTQLKKYDDAIQIVQTRLGLQPRDPLLLSILAGLYYDAGNEKSADSLWSAVIAADKKNLALYRMVASQMIEHRLYDAAIRTYLTGRKEGPHQDAFAEELGSIYSALQQYGAATAEFVRILKRSPDQLPYIENRVASFTMRNDGLRSATSVVQDEIQRTPNNITLRLFLAWLAVEGRDFESAYIQYHVIDSLRKAKGNELFNFAQRAFQEKAYRVSAKAHRDIVEDPNSAATIIPQARFGYARSLEELSAEEDTSAVQDVSLKETPTWPVSESQPSFRGAIALYARIISEYPNSDLAAQAHYRIGLIRHSRFFDLDGALAAFEASRRSAKSPDLQFGATLKIAEVLIAQGKISNARSEYASLLTVPVPAYQDRALFGLAELDYFEGAFDSSQSRLARLTSNTKLDLANDALQLQYFIQENKSSPGPLSDFSQADLMVRQRKFSEALARFKDIVSKNPAAFLIDDAMMRIGELEMALGRPLEALATFQKIVAEIQTSILRDRAQMRIGEVFQNNLKDKNKAIEAYEALLAKFPNSVYTQEARKRVRFLRGDAI